VLCTANTNCKYEGCSIYNETVFITFTVYEIQRHKYYKHLDQSFFVVDRQNKTVSFNGYAMAAMAT